MRKNAQGAAKMFSLDAHEREKSQALIRRGASSAASDQIYMSQNRFFSILSGLSRPMNFKSELCY